MLEPLLLVRTFSVASAARATCIYTRKYRYMSLQQSIQFLQNRLGSSATLKDIVRRCCDRRVERCDVSGLAGSLLPVITALVYNAKPTHILLIVESSEKAGEIFDDLGTLLGQEHVFRFEKSKHYSEETLDAEEHIGQIETLDGLSRRSELIVVADGSALHTGLPAPAHVSNDVFSIAVGTEYDFDTLIGLLNELGFEKKPFVEAYGDYSVRGGIIDVFPYTGHHPVRLDFWMNKVESIREFEVMSQRSIKQLQEVRITPNLLNGNAERTHTIFDHLAPSALIIWDDRDVILHELGKKEEVVAAERIATEAGKFRHLNRIIVRSGGDESALHLDARSQPSFQGSIDHLYRDLIAHSKNGFDIFITADGPEETERIRELIDEVESAAAVDDENGVAGPNLSDTITYIPETLQRGFILNELHLLCYTEHEIFGRLKKRRTKKRKRFKGFSFHEMHSLKRGDYVVHIDHGIGRFDGLHKLTVGGTEQEGVRILYAEKDVLYVNLNAVHRIQKYSSKEGHVPYVNRLGSGEWEKVKARTKRRVKDIARDLILLYAKRKASRGFAFAPDTHWQKELEASFMYDDTPDQADATRAVKGDMELPIPMDRLICGDVGFGKTEVAVRAAFKSALDGKQTAVLVPTTILAEQHFQTFRDRLSRYSVRIDVLSRFRSAAEQKKIVERLRTGETDIVIGTHRLLSKDVGFKDLGLLVVDEEHRFGVTAKEKIRKFRAHVDTLTLTATPIPRTLHFSLMGARDLSIINTPPKNRMPIITEIAPFSEKVIREAIIQELQRDGQVYVVHDRIADIEEIANKIRELIPEARVRIAHGRMRPHELEKTMIDFLGMKFNVLISTKIIESGIDIPNVNTILVNRVERFGLAELYQLRGRVGRSNVQAYAYFLTPPVSTMSRQALRRLQAIEEFTELGSGFNLSMRDLEIRGAGNMLGAEQSGFIEEVGFDMYQKLVEDAVRELKVEEFSDLFPDEQRSRSMPTEQAVVNASVSAYLPDTYISFDAERLEFYRRFYAVANEEQLNDIRSELIDRFGPLPPEATVLLDMIQLRIRATALGFVKVDAGSKRIVYEFPNVALKEYYDSELFKRIIAKVPTLQNVRARIHEIDKMLRLVVHIDEMAGTRSPVDRALEVVDALI
jgi:transcription-repair coupling factor (superfamily II helicase)